MGLNSALKGLNLIDGAAARLLNVWRETVGLNAAALLIFRHVFDYEDRRNSSKQEPFPMQVRRSCCRT